MFEYYYNAYSIAYFLVNQGLGKREQLDFLDMLFKDEREREFISPSYKQEQLTDKENLRHLILDVLYRVDYLNDPESFEKEYSAIENDYESLKNDELRLDTERISINDFDEYDLYFMSVRLRIRFINDEKNQFVKIKLRKLLSQYGYKRRTEDLLNRMHDAMLFYHIQSYLRGGEICDIRDIDIDDMITFRIPGNDKRIVKQLS